MPDPNAKRDRALEKIATAMDEIAKLQRKSNQNFIDAVRLFRGEWHEIGKSAETVSTDTTSEKVEEVKKPRMVMIPVSEASAMTLRECGYDPGFESGTFFVALPILKEEPISQLERQQHKDCIPGRCVVARHDSEFDYRDCPERAGIDAS